MADVTAYLSLPYTRVLETDEDGDVRAVIKELPGCIAHGSDDAEALANLREMQIAWIEGALEQGNEPPLPQSDRELPSGKWVQRVPKSLHARLVGIAKREETSLNQLVTAMLSEAVAVRETWQPRATTSRVHADDDTWSRVRQPVYSVNAPAKQELRYADTLRAQADKNGLREKEDEHAR
jgi:antitoxin HicB